MEKSPFLQPEAFDEEQQQENILRPKRLSDFMGQQTLKDNLSIFIKAALGREENLDHVFISGPPGLGKTTLASIMSHELGADLRVTSAPVLEKPKDLAGLLTTLTEKSVFFIDEVHRLRAPIEEMLYIAMEDYELDWIIGQGPAARNIRIPLPRFTLIGATTKPGKVSSPLLTRFGINLRINFYNEKELETIIGRSAKILSVRIDREAASCIALSARGTPRVANRLLRRMRDFAEVIGDGTITNKIVENGLERLEIDKLGLDRQDRKILRTIIETYSGGPVGADTLAISVGEEIDSLEDYYEPFLIQSGLLMRTPRGRMVTKRAYEHLGIRTKGDENQTLPF